MSSVPEKDKVIIESTDQAVKQAQEKELAAAEERKKAEQELFKNSTVFSAPAKTDSKRHMAPRKKGAIITAVMAAVTAVAVTATLLLLPKLPENTASSDAVTFTVLEQDAKNVTEVSVKNSSSDYKLVYTEYTGSGEKKGTKMWLASGYEDIALGNAEHVIKAATAIKAVRTLGTTVDEAYGLDKPFISVKVVSTDGEYSVDFGKLAPDSSGRYTKLSGDDRVYLVPASSLNALNFAVEDLVELNSVPAFTPAGENDKYFTDGKISILDELRLGGTCRGEEIVIRTPDDDMSVLNYLITKPRYQAANEDNVDIILDNFEYGVLNNGAYVFHCTDEDLKEYGLDKPYSTVYCKVNKNKVTMKFGKPTEDGCYPFTVDDGNVIYKLLAAGNEWVEFQKKDIYFETLFIENIKTIKKIKFNVSGKETVFNIGHYVDETTKTERFTAKLPDGTEMDNDQFKYFYERVVAVSSQEMASDGRPDIDPYMTIEITYENSSRAKDVITVTEYSARRYYYQLNGKGESLVSTATIDDIATCLEKIVRGEKIGRRTQLG